MNVNIISLSVIEARNNFEMCANYKEGYKVNYFKIKFVIKSSNIMNQCRELIKTFKSNFTMVFRL